MKSRKKSSVYITNSDAVTYEYNSIIYNHVCYVVVRYTYTCMPGTNFTRVFGAPFGELLPSECPSSRNTMIKKTRGETQGLEYSHHPSPFLTFNFHGDSGCYTERRIIIRRINFTRLSSE